MIEITWLTKPTSTQYLVQKQLRSTKSLMTILVVTYFYICKIYQLLQIVTSCYSNKDHTRHTALCEVNPSLTTNAEAVLVLAYIMFALNERNATINMRRTQDNSNNPYVHLKNKNIKFFGNIVVFLTYSSGRISGNKLLYNSFDT